MRHKPCPAGHSPLLAGKPWEGWELVLTAFEKAQGVRGLVPNALSPKFADLPPHRKFPFPPQQPGLKGLPILSYSTQGRPAASQGSGGGCNLTTFLSVSNLNWLKKTLFRACHCAKHNSSPWRGFPVFICAVCHRHPPPLPTTAACKLNLSHQIKRKVGLGKPPSKAETVSALS